MPSNFNIQKVLVAPLDWGLGHATRCIPIIRALLSNGYEVLIGAEGVQAILLQTEFPSLQILPLKGYHVRYSKTSWLFLFKIVMQLPYLQRIIKYEHQWLEKIIKEHSIDLVISDNRFGLSSQTIPCIFITHQLNIKAPFVWIEKILQRINYKYINRFTRCWVPDAAGDNNAGGDLSHPSILPRTEVEYMGLLSRFEIEAIEKKYDYCILLSGPEPQRTLLEEKIILGLIKTKSKLLLVRGKPGSNEIIGVPENVTVKNHLPGTELQEAILQSEIIICRSGYTTVMELLSLQKKSILIPTPGQTEQEYLGDRLQQKNICLSVSQSNFDLVESIEAARLFQFQTISLPLFTESRLTELLASL